MQNGKFLEFREKYDTFVYRGFSLEKTPDGIKTVFDFEIKGLTTFRPETVIKTDNLKTVNEFDSETGKALIFSLGHHCPTFEAYT